MPNTNERMPHCDMERNCTSPVTHIGSKGYIYCAEHAVTRRQSGYEQTRKMRQWEIDLINAGQPLPSYEPLPQARTILRDKPPNQIAITSVNAPKGSFTGFNTKYKGANDAS